MCLGLQAGVHVREDLPSNPLLPSLLMTIQDDDSGLYSFRTRFPWLASTGGHLACSPIHRLASDQEPILV